MPWWGWLLAWLAAQLPMGMMVGRVMRHLAREQFGEVHCAIKADEDGDGAGPRPIG